MIPTSDDLVRATTTAFWGRYLRRDGAAGQRLVDVVPDSDGGATLRRDLG